MKTKGEKDELDVNNGRDAKRLSARPLQYARHESAGSASTLKEGLVFH